MITYCSHCGDEYSPVEYREPDIDGPNFCSDECEEAFLLQEEFDQVYNEGRYAGAPAI